MSSYVRIYTGIIEHGRNHGYPITKCEEVRRHRLPHLYTQQGRLYRLVPITEEEIAEIQGEIDKEKEMKRKREKEQKERDDKAKYEELKKRFG